MDAKLKECPFCGASEPRTYSNVVNDKMHAIQCTECPGGITCTSSTFEQAVGAWNRRAIAPPVAAGSVDRPKLHDMTLPETETRDWYFDCDGHYIDVELRKDGHYSIYFRNRADGGKGWLDTGALTERAEKAEARILELQRALLDKVEENLK